MIIKLTIQKNIQDLVKLIQHGDLGSGIIYE